MLKWFQISIARLVEALEAIEQSLSKEHLSSFETPVISESVLGKCQ